MTRCTRGIMAALLFMSLAVPVWGKNYILHSPKLWSQQEKEQYEKNNPLTETEKELIESQKEQAEKNKERLKREKDQAIKVKEQAKKEKEQVEQEKKQAQKEKEQVEKEKKQAKKEKEQVAKEKKQIEKEKERAKREKELVEKAKEQVEKEKERAKIEKEHVEKVKEQVNKEKERIKKEQEQVKKEKLKMRQNQILVKDGVSYREVTVQKGDTLYGISRKYGKDGSSYAETLRFNNIEDPGKLTSGDVIKVPLFKKKKVVNNQAKQPKPAAVAAPKQQKVATVTPKPIPVKTGIQRPQVFSGTTTARQQTYKPPAMAAAKQLPAQTPPVTDKIVTVKPQTFPNYSTSGQTLFEQAVTSYRNGDCQKAILLFNRFLAGHASSLLAADAGLFIADCYLKLSGK
ncbi:MAG: LysM peptidoglycan-binding domain-containing protein [Desulfuromonadales bacterium]